MDIHRPWELGLTNFSIDLGEHLYAASSSFRFTLDLFCMVSIQGRVQYVGDCIRCPLISACVQLLMTPFFFFEHGVMMDTT